MLARNSSGSSSHGHELPVLTHTNSASWAFTSQVDSNRLLVSSYLYKRSSKTHQWKKTWVTLRKCQLGYYKDSSEHKPIKVINRADLLSFNEIPDNHKYHFAIYTSKKVIHFRCEDSNALHAWKHALGVFFEESADLYVEKSPPEMTLLGPVDLEYSGPEDMYLSSGLSDSPMPHDHSHQFQLAQPTIDEEDEDDIRRKPRSAQVPPPPLASSESEPDEYLIEEGHLLRLRKRYNQWKRLYIVLTSRALYFYKNAGDQSKPIKVIPVLDLVDVIELDPISTSKVWCLLVITPLKRLRFNASSEEEMIRWLSALKTLIAQGKRMV
ncbi:PH-domain-containing protein [Suhomyces tanzawaensis NRRL Y-17324]|uniref:PH-domain-containing protein n=1 Tax=Suhomyces tanzawaensis NRRL Y-17324 TaxID=984487 RepID=A0A1E4SPK9_9ASCO|nr:PH-domain-containing protein [Suhomyces tanzawaensis NRRL Y-17324]ODV81443.1 PH-domain-containing protein [Suhomyces tanzawaensis NRRL Y-17324]